MRQLKHQQLFSPKLRLGMGKKKRPPIPITRRIDAKIFLSKPQDKAKLEQALSSQKENMYAFILESKTRRRRVYRWCLGISTVLNIVAWVAFFMWLALQVVPIIDDDVVYVTFHSPDIPPKPILHTPEPLPQPKEPTSPVEEPPEEPPDTSEELPPPLPEAPVEEPSKELKVEPEPPPEEPPAVSEEEADKPVVDPLDINSLRDTVEDTRTQDKTSEPIPLDKFQQPFQDEEHARVVETDLPNLSPLQPKRDSALRGEKQRSTAAALHVPNLQAGKKSEASQQELVKPAVQFRPLHGKGEGSKAFKIVPKPSKEDLKLQRLPELLTPITPRFPPVQGVQTCTVVLWLWVKKNGVPGEISVHEVTPSLDKAKERAFRQAAIEAVKGARFTPARLDGQPVKLLIEIPIWFDRSRQQSHP